MDAITVDIDKACDDEVPDPASIHQWVHAAIADRKAHANVSIRFVNADESAALNKQYRDKEGATNVLSFPADLPDFVELPLLGDIVVCASIVATEAKDQHKTLEAHWAHMIIHGTLHLLGYDHIESHDADIMETLETNILSHLGFPSPYTPFRQENLSK